MRPDFSSFSRWPWTVDLDSSNFFDKSETFQFLPLKVFRSSTLVSDESALKLSMSRVICLWIGSKNAGIDMGVVRNSFKHVNPSQLWHLKWHSTKTTCRHWLKNT